MSLGPKDIEYLLNYDDPFKLVLAEISKDHPELLEKLLLALGLENVGVIGAAGETCQDGDILDLDGQPDGYWQTMYARPAVDSYNPTPSANEDAS